MARALSYLALIVAYLATLFYIAAMCTPWWFTKYFAVDTSDETYYDNNPGLDQHTGLFSMTNCFIDGSCITGNTIYKNNSSLQWVYTTILVLMIVGWIPWLFFLHLLHFRANKNRTPMKGRRALMVISALLTMAIIIAAIITFAVGMVYTNGVYRNGLYGEKRVLGSGNYVGTGSDANDNNNKRQATNNTNDFGYDGTNNEGYIVPVAFGSLPYGNRSLNLLGAGIPLVYGTTFGTLTGALGYRWGAHCAWYCAMIALALIPLALILGLLIKPAQRQVVTTRTTERVVTTNPAVIPQGFAAQPQYVQSVGNNAV